MKLQHLAVIFIIIILPISMVISYYIQKQIDTINLQSAYDTKLQTATYDAIKAFQLNTINNKYSSISDSKIRDIEASINTFYNSLGTELGSNGYDEEALQQFIPAIVYTMYDGYYMYGKYFDYSAYDYKIGLRPYVYYSCRYVMGNNYDFVVNYTLDNTITIYGKVNGEYESKTGPLINPELVTDDSNEKSLRYDGVLIEPEILKEQLIILGDNEDKPKYYEYITHNNKKVYYDSAAEEGKKYFWNNNNEKQIITDSETLSFVKNWTYDGHLHSNSAIEYFTQAKEFSSWVKNNLSNIEQTHAVDEAGNPIKDFSVNTGKDKIFNFNKTDNNPLLDSSVFNQNRISVIRRTIQSNLNAAIANYSSIANYEFSMPIFTEEDWDKIENNVSVATFMQGMPIGAKYYNGYCVITNSQNKEVVTKDSIYIITGDDITNHNNEVHQAAARDVIDSEKNVIGAYKNIDFEKQSVVRGEGNEYYFYPHANSKCYDCIVNASKTYDIDDIIRGNTYKYNGGSDSYSPNSKDISTLRKVYLTALARERFNLINLTARNYEEKEPIMARVYYSQKSQKEVYIGAYISSYKYNISSYKFFIKERNTADNYIEINSGNGIPNVFTYTLDKRNTNYDIKLILEDDQGNSAEFFGNAWIGTPYSLGSINSNITWDKDTHKATLVLSSLIEGYNIEYKKDELLSSYIKTDNRFVQLDNLNLGDKFFAKLYNNDEESIGETEIIVSDDIRPFVDLKQDPSDSPTILKLIVNPIDEQSGIDESKTIFEYRKEGELDYSTQNVSPNGNIYTITDLEENKYYYVRVTVYDKAGNEYQREITVRPGDTIGEIIFGNVKWENNKAYVTITTNTGHSIVYKVNDNSEGNWQTLENGRVTGLSHNDIVYAKIYSGSSYGNEYSKKIEDTKAPDIHIHTIEADNGILTIGVNTEDNESGMPNPIKYNIFKKRKTDTYREPVFINSTNSQYTFTNDVVDGVTYTIKVETVDNAGNKAISEKDITMGQRTGDITIEPLSWKDGKARIRIWTYTSYRIKYTLVNSVTGNVRPGENYANGEIIEGIENKTTVYAQLMDGTKVIATASYYIDDKEPPKIIFRNIKIKSNSIELTADGYDNETGMKENPQYSFYYKLQSQNNTNYSLVTNVQNSTAKITGLEKNKAYDVMVVTEDKAENKCYNQIFKFIAGKVPNGITFYGQEFIGDSNNAKVRIRTSVDLEGGIANGGYDLQYTTDKNDPNSWKKISLDQYNNGIITNYNNGVEVGYPIGTPIYARLYDGKNASDIAEYEIGPRTGEIKIKPFRYIVDENNTVVLKPIDIELPYVNGAILRNTSDKLFIVGTTTPKNTEVSITTGRTDNLVTLKNSRTNRSGNEIKAKTGDEISVTVGDVTANTDVMITLSFEGTAYYSRGEATYKLTITRLKQSILTISPESDTGYKDESGSFNVTYNQSGGTVSARSSNTNIATVSISGNAAKPTITYRCLAVGTVDITVRSEPVGEYDYAEVKFRLTVIERPKSQDFQYTGTVQTFPVQKSGKYKLEVWGAEGGNTVGPENGGNGAWQAAGRKRWIYFSRDFFICKY